MIHYLYNIIRLYFLTMLIFGAYLIKYIWENILYMYMRIHIFLYRRLDSWEKFDGRAHPSLDEGIITPVPLSCPEYVKHGTYCVLNA